MDAKRPNLSLVAQDSLLFGNDRNPGTQDRRMICHCLPHQRPIDAEVLMHQNIAQTYNVLPRHLTVSRLHLGTQPRDRFSHMVSLCAAA